MEASYFVTAFQAGLAAPVLLFAAPPPYAAPSVPTTAGCFAVVARYLGEMIPAANDASRAAKAG